MHGIRYPTRLSSLTRFNNAGGGGQTSNSVDLHSQNTFQRHIFRRQIRGNNQIRHASIDATKGDRERVVILGSGWGGYVFARNLDRKKFQPVIVSPRSYFVFTPLLNEATVGTTEFRTIMEKNRQKGIEFYQGWADAVDLDRKTVSVEESIFDPKAVVAHLAEGGDTVTPKTKGQTFQVSYDKLVVAVGSYAQTFGTKGVKEYAMFLKDVGDGRKVRRRLLELFEVAGLPTFTDEVRKTLLHFAIVGGGPTGMEFAASLRDLIHQDLKKLYPDLIKFVKISVYDVAPKVLPMFDENLAKYAMDTFGREGIQIKTSHHITELRRGLPKDFPEQPIKHEARKGGCYTLTTKEEGEIGIGMCVWSTGNAANPFLATAFGSPLTFPSKSAIIEEGTTANQTSSFPPSTKPAKDTQTRANPSAETWQVQRDEKLGSLKVTDRFQLQLQTTEKDAKENEIEHENKKETSPFSSDSPPPPPIPSRAILRDVYAIGDCALLSHPLPATAQVANQEAKWLSKALNRGTIDTQTFNYRDLGVMTYLGNSKGMMQSGSGSDKEESSGREKSHTLDFKGRQAYWLWKGAYLSMTISWKNRILVAVYWVVARVFGRDINRF